MRVSFLTAVWREIWDHTTEVFCGAWSLRISPSGMPSVECHLAELEPRAAVGFRERAGGIVDLIHTGTETPNIIHANTCNENLTKTKSCEDFFLIG